MGPKLLFILGIVATHGAVAAAWVSDVQAGERVPAIPTCVNAPAPLPWFEPQSEVLAANIVPGLDEEIRLP